MKPDVLPFVPPKHHKTLGESPFRVRGSVYTGFLEGAPRHLAGGLDAIYAEIGLKDIEVFLRETIFLATSSYDLEPLLHFLRAITHLARIPVDKFVREGCRKAAELDVVGTYRAQMRSASPEEMAARLPRIFMRYFEPCQGESFNIHPTGTEMRFSGLPASAIGYYIWSDEGFVGGALEAAGARDIRFTWNNPIADGELDGVPLQSVACRITWTNQWS